ncbi:hypothetical protein Tco_0502111 [Tanacetum coccineum]
MTSCTCKVEETDRRGRGVQKTSSPGERHPTRNQSNGGQGRGNVKVINMVNVRGSRKRPYEMGRPGLTEEFSFPPIPQNSLTNGPIILEGAIEGYHVRRIYVDGGSASKIIYEHCFKNFDASIRSRLRKSMSLLVGFLGETYYPLGLVDLRVTMGEPGRSKTMLLEFAIVKCRSPYNAIMGRTGMRSLRAGGLIGVQPDRRNAKLVEGNAVESAHETNVSDKGTSHTGEQSHSRLTLKVYPLAELVAHKKRPLMPDQRQALKEEVFNWLKEGIIMKVRYPGWVTNAILIKQKSNTWQVQMDY